MLADGDRDRFYDRELPGCVSSLAQSGLLQETLVGWDKAANQLCEEVLAILTARTKELVHQHFASCVQGMLEHQIQYVFPNIVPTAGLMDICRLIMQEHLRQSFLEAQKKIKWLKNIHEDSFVLRGRVPAHKESFLMYYRRIHEDFHRQGGKVSTSSLPDSSGDGAERDVSITAVLNALEKLGFHDLTGDKLIKILDQDKFERALGIMATIRAYIDGRKFILRACMMMWLTHHLVSHKCFADNIPMAIDYELVRGGGQDITNLLWTKLGLFRGGCEAEASAS